MTREGAGISKGDFLTLALLGRMESKNDYFAVENRILKIKLYLLIRDFRKLVTPVARGGEKFY